MLAALAMLAAMAMLAALATLAATAGGGVARSVVGAGEGRMTGPADSLIDM